MAPHRASGRPDTGRASPGRAPGGDRRAPRPSVPAHARRVNRVHSKTYIVWSMWYDYPRIERSLREQELELGLRVTPGHLAKVPGSPELRPKPQLQRRDT